MTIDRYSPCPGGTGKKIKFCCKELLPDLEKMQRMLDGDQERACLETVRGLEAKYPERACLLQIRGMIERGLDLRDESLETSRRFVEQHPRNFLAHSGLALSQIIRGETDSAVESLQSAFENVPDDELHPQLVIALGDLGEALLYAHHPYTGRMYLLAQAMMVGINNSPTGKLLMRANASDDFPLPFKSELDFHEPPADAPYREQAESVLDLAGRLCFRRAAEECDRILAEHPRAADVWYNMALLSAMLLQTERTIAALRTFAALDVPFDEAVEAHWLANLLIPLKEEPQVELVRWTVEFQDIDPLQERLASHPRFARSEFDPQRFDEDSGPPPRWKFVLLDKPGPRSVEEAALEELASVQGEAYVFGRQTDRAPRLEIHCVRGDAFDQVRQLLTESFGDLLELPGSEETSGTLLRERFELSSHLWIPRDCPRDRHEQILQDWKRATVMQKWPGVPKAALEGRTPQEVAGEETRRALLEALVREQEDALGAQGVDLDFAPLREKLQLPLPEPVEPPEGDIAEVPLARLHRLNPESLSDDLLVSAYRRSVVFGVKPALRRLVPELLRREHLSEQVDLSEACSFLAEATSNSLEALQHLRQAEEHAVRSGRSPAELLLRRMMLHIERNDREEAEKIMQRVVENHLNEPGIAETLQALFREYGPPQQPARAMQNPAAGEAQSGKLWTPGGDTPAAKPDAAETQSKLWVPGQ